MKLFITGATGFVGTKLMKALLDQGHILFPLVRNEQKIAQFLTTLSSSEKARVFPVSGDITQPALGVSKEQHDTLKNEIDAVYHTAAYLSFDPSEREKTFFINVEGTKNVVEFTHSIGAKRFFHVSTAYTAGLENSATETIHTTDRSFVNPYEESKCHAEHVVWRERDTLDVSIFRPAIIIGDSKTGEANTTFALYGLLKAIHLVKKMMDRGRIDPAKPMKLITDGTASNNVVPVDYVVDILSLAANHAEKSTIYHISNNTAPSNKDVISWIKDISGVQQLRLVHPDEADTLSREDEIINEPMKVFHSYLTRSIYFDDQNTQMLQLAAGRSPFVLSNEAYRFMIETYFNVSPASSRV